VSRRKLGWREWLLQRGTVFVDEIHSARERRLPKDVLAAAAQRGVDTRKMKLVGKWFGHV